MLFTCSVRDSLAVSSHALVHFPSVGDLDSVCTSTWTSRRYGWRLRAKKKGAVRVSYPSDSHLQFCCTVTTWAIMGAVWEVFEASTDGLGGAGAMRISYYLAENQPYESRIISFKVVFLAAIQAFTLSSIFLLLGPNVSVWLTTNPFLQNMFFNLVGMTAIANFPMSFALTDWSLVGIGQGRFGLATAFIVLSRWFVVYPVASICVFWFHHEITSVAGSIAIGYATAGYALGCVLIRSDWKQLALEAHEELFPPEDQEVQELDQGDGEEGASDVEDSDDDSIIL